MGLQQQRSNSERSGSNAPTATLQQQRSNSNAPAATLQRQRSSSNAPTATLQQRTHQRTLQLHQTTTPAHIMNAMSMSWSIRELAALHNLQCVCYLRASQAARTQQGAYVSS